MGKVECQRENRKQRWVGERREGISWILRSENGGGECRLSMSQCWERLRERERESGKGTDLRGRRGEIERLRSTFLCKLTGLDAQLTGLFWQVSDGPYYYFTAEPLGPCITGHNRTGQAGKKKRNNKKSGMEGKQKNFYTWLAFCAAHWLCTLPQSGHLLHVCMRAMCALVQVCVRVNAWKKRILIILTFF